MNQQTRVVAAAMLVSALAGPGLAATRTLPAPMTVVDAQEYEVFSASSEGRTHAFLNELSAFRRLLEVSLAHKAVPVAIPTRIYLLRTEDWDRYLAPREGVSGLFVPGAFANYLLIDTGRTRKEALPTVFHEYTHYFLRSQFTGDYPPWFSEGIAELLSTATIKWGDVTLELPYGRIYDLQHNSHWIPVGTLLRVDHESPEYLQHTLASHFYAESWALLHYGLIENRAFGQSIFRYLGAVNRQLSVKEAVAEVATRSSSMLRCASTLRAGGSRSARSRSARAPKHNWALCVR